MRRCRNCHCEERSDEAIPMIEGTWRGISAPQDGPLGHLLQQPRIPFIRLYRAYSP
jgi:hypothetical protein